MGPGPTKAAQRPCMPPPDFRSVGDVPARPAPACPIRDGDPCSLCVPGVSGPQDCGLVYLVTSDPELREEWNARRRAGAERRRSA